MITIRQEQPTDYDAVYNMVKDAFAKAEHTDGNEHFLLARLRKSDIFIPELSLVAEQNGQIIGQIMFTKIKIGSTTQLLLAPLTVKIEMQGQGIGGQLICAGHQIARSLGYEYSVLIGHPSYYPRFGYVNAAVFGIKSSLDLPEGVFMAINLLGKNSTLNGVAEFPKVFFEN